jgi:Leucine-rich repeat (LRR) protein
MKRSFLTIVLVVVVVFLASCSKNAENEHLPEYCQTYAGFTATASRDMFELLDDAGYAVNRFNYLSVISEIELEFELDDPNRTVDLGGIQCFQNLTSLSLSGRSFKDISEISALSNIQAIQLHNTSIVSIDSFKNLSKINNLVISETKTLQNVEGVGEMTKLTTLDLSNNGLVNIGELNALVNLQHLYLDHNDIIYFPSINNLEQLETLDISYNDIIQLGDDLSGLRNLEQLNASNNQICDISTLDDLESVEELDLSYNNLGCNGDGVSPNFDSLENATNLRVLKLNNNGLTSIEGLRDRDISLEVLHLHNNELEDITPIEAYTNINELVLYNNNITNLNDLSGMTGLTSIDVSENNISSLTDLMLITTLTHIDLSKNNISIIPDISGEWPNLSVLDLHSNPLVDVSGVEGHPTLETLILYNSGLTVLEGISNLPELDTLVIVDEEVESELDPVDQNPNIISTLINSFNNNPSLSIQQDFILDLGFEFGPNVEIYNSIQGNVSVGAIDWDGLDIDVIDETSIQLPNLVGIDVRNNNLTDIRFILGNPDLELLYLSGNAITNISVINGTDTDDLDNLTLVELENNTIGSNLQNAFIDLPSIEEISLLGTPIVSIDNSFNNLTSLITLELNGTFLQSITDSFNELFSQYRSTNQFTFDGGDIATIDNSFNGGQYHTISITNQSPIIGVGTIVDSFRNLNIVGEEGMNLSGNEFATIINSFEGVTSDLINISNNELFSITTSFVDSEIGTLNLSDNILGSIPGLNLATEITTLLLDDNQLTTVSFIDGISGLSNLSFERQETNGGVDTLSTLDGINNQLDITSFTGDLSGLTSISGLQNTGITDLDLSRIQIGNSGTLSMDSNAFNGTSLVSLNLAGQEISDLAFLSNLTVIEQLNIGLDVVNLSDFVGLPMELTLQDFTFTNVSPLSDFTALSGYDLIETLTLPLNTIHINHLDGMDSLQSLTLNQDSIETISDSFNDVPSFEPNEVYLELFPNILSITRSFDLYGSIDNVTDFVTISGDYAIIDSFRNVAHLNIENNGGDLIPTFDSDSFTQIESIFFEFAAYNSYAFLNGYDSLTSLSFAELDSDITDLSNTNLDIVSIAGSSLTLSTVSIVMSDTGTFLFTSLTASTFDITVNAADISVEATNGDLTLNALNDAISLSGASNGFILNADNLTSLALDSFGTTTAVFNTPLLATITASNSFVIHADTLDIYSNVAVINYETNATTLNVYNNLATDITITNESSSTTIYGDQSNLTVSGIVEDLSIIYDTLENLIILSTQTTLVVDSDSLTSLDTGLRSITTLSLSSNQSDVTINGSAIGTVAIVNPSLTSLTATVDGTDVQVTSSSTTFVLENSSNVGELQLVNMPNLASFTYGSATVDTIEIETTSISLNLTGSSEVTFTITADSLSSLVANVPLAEIVLEDSDTSLTVDGTIQTVRMAGQSTTTITINPSSSITTFTVTSGDNLASFDANDTAITTVTITTGSSSFTLDGSNITSSIVTGLSLNNADIDVGTNNLTLTTGSSSLGLSVNANTVTLTSDTDGITIADSSGITSMTIDSNNLLTFTSGTASIDSISFIDTSSALILSGSNIETMTISSSVESVLATLDIATSLTIVSTTTNPLDITTNTASIDVTADVDITITGSALDSVTASLGSNALSLDMDQTGLTATIAGTAGEVIMTGIDVTGLVVTSGSSFDVLDLTNLGITALDTTGSTIPEIQLTTTESNVTLIAPTATTIGIDGVNLDTIAMTASTADVTISTNQAALSLTGSVETVTLTGSTMTTLTITEFTVDDMNLIVDSMTTLDTLDSIQSSLSIETNQATFDLTTNVPTVSVTSTVESDLSMTSSVIGTINLTTSSSTLVLNAPSTTILLSGEDLASITGTVDTLNASGFTVLALTIDVIGTDIQLTDSGTILAITASGTMDTLTISASSLSSFLTTDLTVNDTLTLSNTSLSTLSFASTTLLNSLVTLDVNTLNTSDIESILTTLDGLTITLISPLTETDIYNYYYAEELANLTAQEAIDQAYYDSIRSTAVNDSWAIIVANEYMDHLDETSTKTAIDNDTLGDEDFYFNSYLSDAGITVGDLAAGEEAIIRSTITATLNSVTSLMDEPTLQADTTAAMEADADTYANAQTNAITFTIG